MSPRKGTDVLLEALRRLPGSLDWSLTLFGNTAGRSRYARWLDDPRLAPRVSLPGKVSQAQLAGAYAAGDVYVVSSRIETANVSMLQAMACGASVVTTRCGAPETLLDDSVSISVKPDSPTEMAEAIARVATRRTRFDRRRQREFVVERYGKRAVAEKIIKAYGTVMGRTVL